MSSETLDKFQYSFAGKKVLITGGGRGLGHALVSRLYNDGAVIFILEKNPELVSKLHEDFPDKSRLTAVVCDLTKWTETQELIISFGPMDHLVNCAAIFNMDTLMEAKEELVDLTLNVNLKSLLCVSQAVGKGMISAGIRGTIVNMSSIAGHIAYSFAAVYSISKAGVLMLTKCLALELGKHGIRTNSISPTAIDTQLVVEQIPKDYPLEKLVQDAATSRQPLAGKSILDKEDVVNSILFLLSPLSSLANGMDLVLDGGVTAC